MVERSGRNIDKIPEAALRDQKTFYRSAVFLTEKLGPAFQAGAKIDINLVDKFGSRAQLAFAMLFMKMGHEIQKKALEAKVDLSEELNILFRLGVEKNAVIFSGLGCAKLLLEIGFSLDFVRFVCDVLKIEVPSISEHEELKSCIGTVFVRVADIVEELNPAVSVVDTKGDDALPYADTIFASTDELTGGKKKD